MFRKLSEVDENDGYNGMLIGRVWMFNIETNREEYVYVMLSVSFLLIMDNLYRREGVLCNAQTTTSPARFKTLNPPIIIVDVIASEGKKSVRMTDLKRIITVNDVRYV